MSSEKEKTDEPDTKLKSENSEESASSLPTSSSSAKDTMSVDFVDNSVEEIRRYLAKKLGFTDDDEVVEDKQVKILKDVSIDGIVDVIKSEKAKNIITLAGAGISTAAGIPDFRSPGSGLYNNLQKYNLPHPQAVFDIEYFEVNPKPFFTLAKELYPGVFKPTLSHYFIKLLNDKGLLLRHYTQNIDTLERVAGIPGEKLVEAHGTFNTGHCTKCRRQYSQQWMKDIIFQDNIPTCTECKGVVKPDIVFFGENLPDKFYECVSVDFKHCDLLIVLGSSLVVQPFASLIDKVPATCPRLLINREKAGQRDRIMKLLNIGGGMDFDNEKNSRDVAYLGNCDDGCKTLAEKLGWQDDLDTLIKEGHRQIDSESASKKGEGARKK